MRSPTYLNRSDLSPKERIAYTNAVLCLQSKPPRTPASVAPGAKSRFDDFIVAHVNQTFTIHSTVSSPFPPSADRSTALILKRVVSSHGTATTRTPMRRHLEMNVDIKVTNPTGTGVAMPRTSSLFTYLHPMHYSTYTLTFSDPIHSPLFDGSPTSMGGNGYFTPYAGTPLPIAQEGVNDTIPPAEGGGCVTTGPFKKYHLLPLIHFPLQPY